MATVVMIYENQVINGRIDHVVIDKNVTTVDCWNCTSLRELPYWWPPHVKIVNCSNCPLISELPCWTEVKEVNCCNCPLITELPCWPKVIKVSCLSCHLISKLPCWPKVIYVYCSNCSLISELPLWPKIEWLISAGNPRLVEIPYYPMLKGLDCSYGTPNLLYIRNENLKNITTSKIPHDFYTSETRKERRTIVFLLGGRGKLSKDLWRLLYTEYLS